MFGSLLLTTQRKSNQKKVQKMPIIEMTILYVKDKKMELTIVLGGL